ncbi:hypothetical protein RZ760_010400 [Providencia rettgeri]|nr:hypothetical protein [Providencia rettgeri]
MDINNIIEDIRKNVEHTDIVFNQYEEKVNELVQKTQKIFSDTANEANGQDFDFFNAIMRYIQHDFNKTKQFFNFISMKKNIFINALEEHDMAFVQFNVVQEEQLRRQTDNLQTSLSKYEYLNKFKESLGDMLGDYQESYRDVLVEMQSLIESRHRLLNELQSVNHSLEPIRTILDTSISIGKLPRELTLDDITHVSIEVGNGLSSYINALAPIEDGVSNTNRDTSLDMFLPQQLCHVRP